MIKIVRYLLEGDGTIPKFIKDGGYFPKGYELVGVTVDDSMRYVPSTVPSISKAELIARALEVMLNKDGSPITQAQAESIVQTFLDERNMSDYQ